MLSEQQALKIIIKTLDERMKLITDTLNTVHSVLQKQNKTIEELALEMQMIENKIQKLEDKNKGLDKPSWR